MAHACPTGALFVDMRWLWWWRADGGFGGWSHTRQGHTKSKKLIAGRLVDTEEQVTVKVTQAPPPLVAWELPSSSAASSAPEHQPPCAAAEPKASSGGGTRPLDSETEQVLTPNLDPPPTPSREPSFVVFCLLPPTQPLARVGLLR